MSDALKELYHVADDVSNLFSLREELAEAGEDTAPIDTAVEHYFAHELTKDKIAQVISYLRYCEHMEMATKNEVSRLDAQAKSWKAKRDWLRGTARQFMEQSGQKRLEGGTAGHITLRANGGRQSVTITDPSLVPDELCRYTLSMNGREWHAVITWHLGNDNDPSNRLAMLLSSPDVKLERTPRTVDIGAALALTCVICKGSGLVYAEDLGDALTCLECAGDGLARIPGARLEPRSNSVLVK